MSLKFNGTLLKKHTHNGSTVKKWTHNGVVVYTNGTTVSYYNGTTLLGTKTVAEGNDVLHPGYSPTKSGYTFVGWATSRYGSRVTTLKASGDTMTLYAVFAINYLTVLDTGTGWNDNHTEYNYSTKDTDYILSGKPYVYESKWNSEGSPFSSTERYYLYLGEYGKATVYLKGEFGFGDNQKATYDGTSYGSGSGSFTGTTTHSYGGYHTLVASGVGGPWYGMSSIVVDSIVLSNPTKWE